MSRNRRVNSTKHAQLANLLPNPAWLAFFKEVRRLTVLAKSRRQLRQRTEPVINPEKGVRNNNEQSAL